MGTLEALNFDVFREMIERDRERCGGQTEKKKE